MFFSHKKFKIFYLLFLDVLIAYSVDGLNDRTKENIATMFVLPFGWVTNRVSVHCEQTGSRLLRRLGSLYYRVDYGR